jgi:mono/diheme cytochrome c family protein
MVAEGARMVHMICAQCHRSSEDGRLGGAPITDAPEFGELYGRNITQHPEFGITDYSDGEIAYLLRTGINKDGKHTPPYMPEFPHLSDRDLHSIIAFLRSDHPMVQPSEVNLPESKPSLLTKVLMRVAFKPLPYPEHEIVAPDATDKVAYGRYIALAKVDCFSCHSESFTTMNVMKPEKTPGFFGGGNMLLDKEGNRNPSANLTMDTETGLGNWTYDQFYMALKHGRKPDGTTVRYPMFPYTLLSDFEVEAIWEYLQTVPVIRNEKLKD